jgi:hypothetical protein
VTIAGRRLSQDERRRSGSPSPPASGPRTAGPVTAILLRVTDDEWRMIDHSPNVALAIAWQWSIAVGAQAARVRDGAAVGRIPDAYLLVLAVRHVRCAADMAMRYFTTAAGRDQLRNAVDNFDAELPGVKEIRDILERCDDYARGVGG